MWLQAVVLTMLMTAQGAETPGRARQAQEDVGDTMRLMFVDAARRELGLSDEQTLMLLPKVDELEKLRRESGKRRRQLALELKQLSEQEDPGAETVAKVIAQLDSEEAAAKEREQAVRDDMLALLEPRQQARFILFSTQFRRRLEAKLQQLRRRNDNRDQRWRQGRRDQRPEPATRP